MLESTSLSLDGSVQAWTTPVSGDACPCRDRPIAVSGDPLRAGTGTIAVRGDAVRAGTDQLPPAAIRSVPARAPSPSAGTLSVPGQTNCRQRRSAPCRHGRHRRPRRSPPGRHDQGRRWRRSFRPGTNRSPPSRRALRDLRRSRAVEPGALDHVLVRDLQVIDAGAVDTDASDGRAVWILLSVRRASGDSFEGGDP
jgi:hypothetical protein